MTLRSFAVERYRGFKARTEIKVRPLTLLFGYNSAGKSALLRVLPLLRDTLREGCDPIYFGSDAVRGARFGELRCRLSESPVIAVELASEDDNVRYEIRDLAREERQVVERVLRRRTGDVDKEVLEWTLEGTRYELQRRNQDPELCDLHFRGLDLEVRPLTTNAQIRWGVPASDMLRRVQWLDAVRARIPRRQSFGARLEGPIAFDGSDAPNAFALANQDGSPVVAWVKEFYRKHLHHEIDVAPLAEDFQIRVSPVGAPTMQLPLVDTGEGLAQVFPVAVALARAGTPEGPHLLALEQPELHLHPALHEELASWTATVIKRAPQARVVVETHSENFLLAVMLAIMEDRLKPDDVVLYWVHQLQDGQCVVEEVTLDELARPQGAWPPGVFQEDAMLATRLNTLRMRRTRR